jgi:hypothetical protein
MSMYADLLSSALDRWVDELSGPLLLDYVRICRDAMTHPGIYGGMRSADVLAAEIAYDRSLIRLCDRHAIAVEPDAFVFPTLARARLEAQLARAGVSLELPSPGIDERLVSEDEG